MDLLNTMLNLTPGLHVREVSPPAPAAPKSVNQKGPEVYYPPGSEFTKSVQEIDEMTEI